MLKFPVIATALLCVATSVSAAKPTGSGPNPFSDCGIGAALFSDGPKWAAVTSNIIWDVGTTAVTSATMSPETCNGKSVKTAQFIIDNYDNLAEETALGQGEHLTAMLTVRGCQGSTHQTIVSSIREDMVGNVMAIDYSALSDVEKAAQYYQAMDAGVASAADSCSA
ncbi:DUF3015 family protein [Endozoicomonas ascidiicola]|uniref:DUF3015 family protein n=1 Tax=Endozoicomonas ascidiicola TaxID=1698521 RepID=UPI000829A993|nr:DUF3015 family protein [Endozoicomonas ascidiicola]